MNPFKQSAAFTFRLNNNRGCQFARSLKTWRRLAAVFVALLLLASMVGPSLRAHGGGEIQIAGVAAGPYRVTVWLWPTVIRVGRPLHVTVAVTEPADDRPVLDADVSVQTLSPAGELVNTARATTAQSTNRLFYETDFTLSVTGNYRINVLVSGPSGQGEAGFDIVVQPAAPVNWLWIGLASLGVLVSVAIYRSWQKRPAAPSPARRPKQFSRPGLTDKGQEGGASRLPPSHQLARS